MFVLAMEINSAQGGGWVKGCGFQDVREMVKGGLQDVHEMV